MRQHMLNFTRLTAATLRACVFWGALGGGFEAMRPSEPHPGLRDGDLKQALRKDRKHDELTYFAARQLLFNQIDGDGRKATGRYTGEEIKYLKQPLPNKGAVEHAWPLTRLPEPARSDLHHMYAVIPDARLARVNLHYGDVVVAVWAQGGSRSGPSRRVVPVFEVRKESRGDIARSMFYVATMYDLEIPEQEEKTLRSWHKQDPVSKEERERNDRIAKHQKSRNPYIDYPNLTNRIKDF